MGLLAGNWNCSIQTCLISLVSLQSVLVISIFGYLALQQGNNSLYIRKHGNEYGERVFVRPNQLSPEPSGVCHPVSNFAFIKTHKTGSTTIRTITSRFGYTRNLSFLLNNDGRIGHFNGAFLHYSPLSSNFLPPLGVERGDFVNYRNYNISNVHLRYTRKGLSNLMYDIDNLKLFSILRSPEEQWLSWFKYYKKYRRLEGFTAENISLAAMPYINNLERENRDFNQQSRDLGVSDNFHFNDSMLGQVARELDRNFILVLIMEYFDESLILLRKLMCWTFDDILYVPKRQQPTETNFSNSVKTKLLEYNNADRCMYEYFNRTLWQKIQEYGQDFEKDLASFRSRLLRKQEECVGSSSVVRGRREFVEYHRMNHSSHSCDLYVDERFELEAKIYKRQSGNITHPLS